MQSKINLINSKINITCKNCKNNCPHILLLKIKKKAKSNQKSDIINTLKNHLLKCPPKNSEIVEKNKY